MLRWQQRGGSMATVAASWQPSVAARQRQSNRRSAAIVWQRQGGGIRQHGSRLVAIVWRQQHKGSGNNHPNNRQRGSALLLLPLLVMPPKNKCNCSLAAEQWQWRHGQLGLSLAFPPYFVWGPNSGQYQGPCM
jgi:hypothetical protein